MARVFRWVVLALWAVACGGSSSNSSEEPGSDRCPEAAPAVNASCEGAAFCQYSTCGGTAQAAPNQRRRCVAGTWRSEDVACSAVVTACPFGNTQLSGPCSVPAGVTCRTTGDCFCGLAQASESYECEDGQWTKTGAAGCPPCAGGSGGGGSGGSAAGGAGPAGGASGAAGGVSGGAGGQAGSGGPAAGESGATDGGSTGEAGQSGMHAGFSCGEELCATGEACVRCVASDDLIQICTPHPDLDPSGYQNAIGGCDRPPAVLDDCDGPEECAAGRYCVVDLVAEEDPPGRPRRGNQCRDEPVFGSCCFSCDALPSCTLCREQADCPTESSCATSFEAPGESGGCVPIPA